MSIIEFNDATPNPALGPACSKCAGRTRLIGIEPHPTKPRTDLRTYECMACDALQARVVPVAS